MSPPPYKVRECQIYAESVHATAVELFGLELAIMLLTGPAGDTFVLLPKAAECDTTRKMRISAALMNAAERLAGDACGRPCRVRLEYGEPLS